MYSIEWSERCPRLDFVKSTKQLNRRGNNNSAERYHATWSNRLIHGAVGKFLGCFEDNAAIPVSVLDAGCGPGMYTHAFRSLGLKVTAIDSSSEMLRIARETFPGQFLEGDVTQPDTPAGSFDGIWCSAVMVHVPRRIAPDFLQNLRRALKPGGILYLSVQLGAGCRTHPDGRTFFYYAMPEIMAIIAGASFEILDVWQSATAIHTHKAKAKKTWCQFLLKKAAIPYAPAITREFAKIVNTATGCVDFGTVYSYSNSRTSFPELDEAQDARDLGWFTIAATLFRESIRGKIPDNMVLDVEQSDSGGAAERLQFLAGVEQAVNMLQCPVKSIRLREGTHLKSRALVSSRRAAQLPRRPSAGDHLVLLGQPGVVLAALGHRRGLFSLPANEGEELIYLLRHPQSLHRETTALLESGRASALLGGSGGLAEHLNDLASAHPTTDIHVDLATLLARTPDAVRKADAGSALL